MATKLEKFVKATFVLLALIGHISAHGMPNENKGTAKTDEGKSTGSVDHDAGWKYRCGCDSAPDGSWTYKWGTGSGPDGSTYGYGAGSGQSPDGGGFGFGWGSSSSPGAGSTGSSGAGTGFGFGFGSGGDGDGDGNADDGVYWLEYDPTKRVHAHPPEAFGTKYYMDNDEN